MKQINFQKFCQNHWTLLCSRLQPLRPSVPSTVWSYVPSSALCHLYGPLPPLRRSILSMALCPSKTLCPLYCICLLFCPFTRYVPSVPSKALPLHGPLSPLWPSLPSMAL